MLSLKSMFLIIKSGSIANTLKANQIKSWMPIILGFFEYYIL